MSLSPGRSCARSRHSNSPLVGDVSLFGGIPILLLRSAWFSILYKKKNCLTRSLGLKTEDLPYAFKDPLAERVELDLNRVIGEVVLDGGGQISPAGIDGVNTLTLL